MGTLANMASMRACAHLDHPSCCGGKVPPPEALHPLNEHAASLAGGCKAFTAAPTQGDTGEAWLLVSTHALERAIAPAEILRRQNPELLGGATGHPEAAAGQRVNLPAKHFADER